jgi:hypothetical protein
MCAKCRDILDTIGKVRNCGRMMDDFENIQAIVHHLGTLQCNLPRSTGELYEDLYRLLGEKTQFIRQKAEAFAAYLG